MATNTTTAEAATSAEPDNTAHKREIPVYTSHAGTQSVSVVDLLLQEEDLDKLRSEIKKYISQHQR